MAKNILIQPIVTEKVNMLSDKFNRYGFIVDMNSSKIEIKRTVELMYGVKVIDVNTSILRGKPKMRYTKAGMQVGRSNHRKKAFVTLAKGDVIDHYKNL